MTTGFVSALALRIVRRSLPCTLPSHPQQLRLLRARPRLRMMSSSSTSTGKVEEPTMVRARHILVETEEMVDAIQKQLDDGKGSFAELASLVSICTSKARGGDLGWFRRKVMVKDFENAVFKNPPGSVVKVKTEFGWHLIKVEDHGMAASAMSVEEFAERFGRQEKVEEAQLIDCREVAELEKASLPGFLNLPMGEYGRWADEFDRGMGLDKDKETIVMCHHGVRSANFCSFLAQNGFTRVRNLSGGIDAYAKKVDPSVPVY